MIKIDGPLSQNITVVYDTLDLSVFDTAKLKGLADNPIRPTMVETPDMVTMVLPPYPVVIQVGDRRIRFTVPQGATLPAFNVLPNLVNRCVRNIVPKQSKLIAYGFNYDISILVEQNPIDLLNKIFIPEIKALNDKLNGELIYTAPRLIFRRNNIQYDLIFELVPPQHILAHVNAHSELREKLFPSFKELRGQFEQEYLLASQTLLRLFDGAIP